MIGKSKVVALISVVAITAILGTLMLTASANGEDTTTTVETKSVNPSVMWGRMGWLSNLTDEQRTELQTMREEFQSAVQAKLTEWGVQIEPSSSAKLTDAQRTELQTMRQEFTDAVKAKLDEWGVKAPEFNGPNGWLSNLTDEQRAELKTMGQEFQDAVKAKLDQWGVEAPKFQVGMGFGGFGPMRRGSGGFGMPGMP